MNDKAHLCPLKRGPEEFRECDREACMMWVEIEKSMPNPLYVFAYEGCGLVVTVPWRITKREKGGSFAPGGKPNE